MLFLSIHGQPQDAFPFFSGYADETGEGDGEGFTVNLPLPPGTSAGTWFRAFDAAARRISEFSPDLLIVSLGVDIHLSDPISFFGFATPDFRTLGERLGALDLPSVILLEGGYHIPTVGENVAEVLGGLIASNRVSGPRASEAIG